MTEKEIFGVCWDDEFLYYLSIPKNQFSRRLECEVSMYNVLTLMLTLDVITFSEKDYLWFALDSVSVNVNEMWKGVNKHEKRRTN